MRDAPQTQFLKTPDGAYIAYQVVGGGPADVAVAFNSDESNVDLMWEEPDWRPFLRGFAQFARLIVHDRRGIGVSSRNVSPPNLETQVSDQLMVLDAVRSAQPLMVGGTQGGAMQAVFAATHPDRTKGLLWNGPSARTAWAPDYPWGLGPEDYERQRRLYDAWGTNAYAESIARVRVAERRGIPAASRDALEVDPDQVQLFARINRSTATPDVVKEIFRIDWETDIRAVLPSIHAPAALVSGTNDNVEEARHIASLMPNATLHVLEGSSGLAVEPIVAIVREMAGVTQPPLSLNRVLATVLFTDIVGSTEQAARLGDTRWRELLGRHHQDVRARLERFDGHEINTTGDGFLATFDGPARAVRCALDICQTVRSLGLDVRAGIHTGELERIGDDVVGIAVHIGARVSALAQAGQVLVSRTVVDLVAGSGLQFDDHGEHQLKGIPGTWHVFTARS